MATLTNTTTNIRSIIDSVTSVLKGLRYDFISGFRQTWFYLLSSSILLLQPYSGQAQIGQTSHSTNAEADSSRGYWRLKTQATTRSTLIQFFGANKQLLYEETLPGKYVKLSRKNQKQFDILLEQLLANQLLTSRIKTELLPPASTEPEQPIPALTANNSQNPSSIKAPYLVHAYVNQTGKLRVIVNNPDRLRYAIKLVDQRNQPLYEEFTNHNYYRRWLDLSAINYDSYQLIVRIDNKPFIYILSKQPNKIVYDIHPKSILNSLVTVEQNEEGDKHPIPPTTINL